MLQHPNSKRIVRDYIAKATTEWPKAGDYKGYMAIMLGFYESAVVRLTDTLDMPEGTEESGSASGSVSKSEPTIGQYLYDEAFVPIQIDDAIYIGLPDHQDSMPNERIASFQCIRYARCRWFVWIPRSEGLNCIRSRDESVWTIACRCDLKCTKLSKSFERRRENKLCHCSIWKN
jgi:hypothetical protein